MVLIYLASKFFFFFQNGTLTRNPGESGDIGEFGDSGDSGKPGGSGDSGETGESGDSGEFCDSGNSGKKKLQVSVDSE